MKSNPRASVLRNGKFGVETVNLPALGPSQLRVSPVATGICGTDLSAWAHTDDFLSSLTRFGATNFLFDPDRPLVFGHEFTSEILETGEDVSGFEVGDLIFTMPLVFVDGEPKTVGYHNTYHGGLSEEVIVDSRGHIRLDPEIDPVLAAILDPVCTGIEGVRRTGIGAGQPALVTGVGPVGLGAVIELVARGASPIVVSDPSERRRDIALQYGATVAIDPGTHDPIDTCRSLMDGGDRLRIIEASGAPGLLDALMTSSPKYTIIVVMGATSRGETIFPMGATTANVSVVFASGPDFGETRYEALYRGYDLLRDGAFDASLMVTAYTGLEGVQAAFDALRPQQGAIDQVKILIVPSLASDHLLTRDEYLAAHNEQ